MLLAIVSSQERDITRVQLADQQTTAVPVAEVTAAYMCTEAVVTKKNKCSMLNGLR